MSINSASPEVREPREYEPVNRRTVFIAAVAIVIAVAAALCAEILTALIGLATNLAFYGRASTALVSAGGGHRNPAVLLFVPIAGAIIVGLMARYGSASIRGHGIPEVMERVLFGESRISGRVLFLKPLSTAVAIGTGGPFGAEGPIIATGGALGSLVGQFTRVTSDERKTLLAAGAAAGMAATFGSPVAAVLLSVELLLFEYRPRSLIPVALAAATATAVRILFHGNAPVFEISTIALPNQAALAFYVVLGAFMGVVAAGITRISYAIEDVFHAFGERYHIHWMWWPAFGAIAVGVVGLIEPRTLGVGYENITGAIGGEIVGKALILLVLLKFTSWAIYLGSGTSGGTLAPLFTIGSGLGAWLGAIVAAALPSLGIDPHVAGLVGMATIFAGASHALLTSIVFVFETTRQPMGLLPLLGGCSAAFLTSILLSRYSIMTEKLARRGVSVRTEYAVDHLSHVMVEDAATRDVVTLHANQSLPEVREWLAAGAGGATHQGFPVLDEEDQLVGVVTRRDLFDPAANDMKTVRDVISRPPVVVYEDSTLRDAADQMVLEHVGRVAVVQRGSPRKLVGIVSRSDLLSAHATRLDAAHRTHRARSVSLIS